MSLKTNNWFNYYSQENNLVAYWFIFRYVNRYDFIWICLADNN